MTMFWQKIFARTKNNEQAEQAPAASAPDIKANVAELDIAPDDPLGAYLVHTASAVEIDKLNLNSPALERLRAEGVKIAVPLVSQGELIGLINLGPRRSEQEYSSDDRRLLNTLATQAAPALRVAQLARQQQIEARERERIEQELRVARIIQQTLLPREVPDLPGWMIDTFWRPAREVGGDFYDFLFLPDGRLGVLIADVTDKGVPAALVMATTRTLLRTSAERLIEPGKVLEHTNEQLHPDIPAKMFVTCLYAVFDPATGHLVFANAGHNLPYLHGQSGVSELRATGMPLGLMPGMQYEEAEVTIQPGESILLTSDGLIEAHNAGREMFGFERTQDIIAGSQDMNQLVHLLIDRLNEFTGPNHEQEDDITLVMLGRLAGRPEAAASQVADRLAAFEVSSEPGNERLVARKVLESVATLEIEAEQRQRLETAVSEAALNAIEHGNKYQQELPVEVEVLQKDHSLHVRIRDHGGGTPFPAAVEPDLEAKLAGLQSPRGWGLFLIRNMVDEMNVSSDEHHHTIELIVNLQP
jgi:serine phosphatase RsbU (regulator of sigma subunit)/anti-sigma regulatory factor (Ser/Thr protein kinase)